MLPKIVLVRVGHKGAYAADNDLSCEGKSDLHTFIVQELDGI